MHKELRLHIARSTNFGSQAASNFLRLLPQTDPMTLVVVEAAVAAGSEIAFVLSRNLSAVGFGCDVPENVRSFSENYSTA